MSVYVRVVLRAGDDLLKGFETDEEAVAWLREEVIPKQMGNIAHIHVDRTK